jgi:hypothetical protein
VKAYVVCKIGFYHPTKPNVRVPKLYVYMSNFEVKADASTWCVVIVDDASQIPPAAQTDPDIFVFDTAAELDTVLTTPKRNAVNSVLSQTSWNVTAVNGDTARSVLGKIRAAMGDSVESWGLGV